jgi:hypothetical protein
MILGEAMGGVPNCLSPAKRDEFLGRTEQAIEASKYAAADEENFALCRIINVLPSKSDLDCPLSNPDKASVSSVGSVRDTFS